MMNHLDFKNWRPPEPPSLTIKPCPACGSANAHIITDYAIYVHCQDCGLCGPLGNTLERAIAAWNRRAPDPDMMGLLTRLLSDYEQALKYLNEYREDACLPPQSEAQSAKDARKLLAHFHPKDYPQEENK